MWRSSISNLLVTGSMFDNFSDNFIDGNEFTKLTEAEVKDLVPPIGLAKKIIRMIPKVCVCVCTCVHACVHACVCVSNVHMYMKYTVHTYSCI